MKRSRSSITPRQQTIDVVREVVTRDNGYTDCYNFTILRSKGLPSFSKYHAYLNLYVPSDKRTYYSSVWHNETVIEGTKVAPHGGEYQIWVGTEVDAKNSCFEVICFAETFEEDQKNTDIKWIFVERQ